jgi:RNA polymerase sigma-70 factor (ECF subfamily)
MNLYQNHTDTELVSLLIEGNPTAFEAIYRRYASDLYRYARKNISSKEDCEEIIQDVFESLWTRHDELEHVTVLSAYLFRMVKYKVIRYFQHSAVKKRYAEHYLLFEAVYESWGEQDKEGSPVQSLIDKGLADLPERCRLAVKLRLTEDLSNGDIAKRMNIQKSTVENYMVTAFNHLRTLYPHLYKATYPEN